MSSRLLSRTVHPTCLLKNFPIRRTIHDTPASTIRNDPNQAASAEVASSGLDHQNLRRKKWQPLDHQRLKRKKWHTRRITPKEPASLPCDPSIYRRICDLHSKRFGAQTLRHQPQEATNQLFHPTSASPQLTLRYFRDQDNVDTFMQWSKQSMLSMAARGLRAAYMLRLRGRKEDAQYMESVSIKTYDWIWTRREMLYKGWRKDPKLKKMHAESPFVDEVWSEMEEGV